MEIGPTGLIKDYLTVQRNNLQEQVQLGIMRKVMEQEQDNMQRLLKTMPPPNPPHLGNNIDIIG